ncbi:DUF262 domain-containing protein [Flavobacterium granuli]|uniref:Uncharacterized protein DUF262 n=1 Tax=Flavobacterium granuli TaxID=280093 RepID=A0A1M5NYD4_9FLAO|nr:DUF262 domain-containing protein [Flavobacterium granuli]PRZ23442.1 uncharacterized protein DUF262 [Flavobacterium granuli]SHG94540.1 Protein of unknown function DUF262 [Flavobacterium granuli]
MDSIRDIFSNRIFRIPDYQRGYSWEKSHLDDFWQDIFNLQKDKVHYTGMISVEEVDKNEYGKWKDDKWVIEGRNDKPYFIVDGQQRLTTVVVLLWVIIDSLKEDEQLSFVSKETLIDKYIFTENKGQNLKSYIFGYHKDNPSYEFLKREIFEQKGDLKIKDIEETTYTNNLFATKDFFTKKIKSLSLQDKSNLFDKVTKQLKFDFKILDKELDIFIVFETMNNRGKPLSNLEKLKNRLIYLSTLIDEETSLKKELRNDINENWKTIYKYLGLNKERKLDDDAFLQNHWIVFYRYERREAEYYANDIFDRIFTSQQVFRKEIGHKEIKIYIDSIAEAVKQWFVIFNPSHPHALELTQSKELLYWLKKQNIVGFKAFQPLIMATLLSEDDNNLKIELVKNTEAYVFLIFNISARRSNTGTYHFNAKANELYKKDLTIKEIIDDLKFWIYGTDEVSGYFDRDNFFNFLKDLFQRDATSGYADWKYLKYLLYEYELSLDKSGLNENTLFPYNGLSVQNVMPFDPVKVCWKNNFSSYSKREKKYLSGSLGNFILVNHKSIDSTNTCFDDMRGVLSLGLLNEKEASDYEVWDYNTVLDRGFKILSFIEERWNISLGNEGHKKELLFLDFRLPSLPVKVVLL